MIELDKLMNEYGISVEQMMELAGLHTAQLAMKLSKGKRILVMAGSRNNGGDGLVAARHLHNLGYKVDFVLAKKELSNNCKVQHDILKPIGVNEVEFSTNYDLLIDALLGFNLKGDPKGKYAELIELANNCGIPILSVDLPSGLDADSGKPSNPCIKAKWTITMASAKKGMLTEEGKKLCGEIYVAYIGVPKILFKKLGVEEQEFPEPIVKLEK